MCLTIPRPEFYIPLSKEMFLKKDYPEDWIQNWSELYKVVRSNPDRKIRVVVGEPDDACLYPCVRWVDGKCISSIDWASWDKKAAKRLKLAHGDEITVKALIARIVEEVSPEKPFGLCLEVCPTECWDKCAEVLKKRDLPFI
jgi:hypothetical protein